MIPLTRILCAVDFSDGSRHALDHAAALARQYGAGVSVLYVHRMPVPVPAVGHAGGLPPIPLSDVERAQIVERLSEFVAEDRKAGIPIDTLFDEDLVVPRAIVQSAAHLKADLIALGTHGYSGLMRLVLGSVANTVMKTAGRPVLVVPPRVTGAVPLRVQRVVCPIDFSALSRRSLCLAASVARTAGARLTVVHVLELPEAIDAPSPDVEAYRTGRFLQARACLDDAVTPALRESVAVDELLLVGKPYHEVLRVAAAQQADLLVMGVQGKGALDALAFGSTTHRVVRQSTCPVLTVPGGLGTRAGGS